ncbi:hypothetical protein ACHHYP_06433 [Achlya hypogyna]|uniref:Secreted protein n=1 Tax=Achlya hypogyna TaxID=1202772 RepID=A0A1V9YU97_ACHHY|nr:hypothetical protein ACHHYP_06433 [Achlya hypogyna]
MENGFLVVPLVAVFLQQLIAGSRAISIPDVRFNFNAQTDRDCQFKFRFTKSDIIELVRLFRLPDPVITDNRYRASAVEATCIMLNRLAWPHRRGTMTQTFGRSREALSGIANYVMQHRPNSAWMERCAAAVYAKGAPLATCIGFIDGTYIFMAQSLAPGTTPIS